MFGLLSEKLVPVDAIDDERLARLRDYWNEKRNGRAMPSRSDIDPLELKEHLGRLHLIEVLDDGTFRYRIYGSRIANPDGADMTGRTAGDYRDTAFAAMTSRHYQACVERAAPVYHHVIGQIQQHRFEFKRLCLPLSHGSDRVEMILAAPVRLVMPEALRHSGRFESG